MDRFGGAIEAEGRTYGVLDKVRFSRSEDDAGNVWWEFISVGGSRTLIQEGDHCSVTIDGEVQSPDLVPYPWGLVMSLEGVEHHLHGAEVKSGSDSHVIVFENTHYQGWLRTDPIGRVLEKHLTAKVPGEVTDEDLMVRPPVRYCCRLPKGRNV